MPLAESCRLLPVDCASLRPGFVNDTYFLLVSGIKPYAAMTAKLLPRIYTRKPDWWEVEVVGCLESGIVADVTGPYSEQKEIWFWGNKGIEVIGRDFKQRFERPTGSVL